MAEVNIGGITFKGGKMLAVILALGSSIGVLYGGFEAYKKFQYYFLMLVSLRAFFRP